MALEDESWSVRRLLSTTRVRASDYLGYIGDVNGEDASTNVILCMLGLPAQSTNVHMGGLRQAGDASGSAGQSNRKPGKGSDDSGSRGEYRDSEDDLDEDDWEDQERMMNGGFTHDELNELLCQGIKPWDKW